MATSNFVLTSYDVRMLPLIEGRIGGSSLALLDVINRRLWGSNECTISAKQMCRESGVEPRNRKKVLARLQDAGWITIEERSWDGGKGTNCIRRTPIPMSRLLAYSEMVLCGVDDELLFRRRGADDSWGETVWGLHPSCLEVPDLARIWSEAGVIKWEGTDRVPRRAGGEPVVPSGGTTRPAHGSKSSPGKGTIGPVKVKNPNIKKEKVQNSGNLTKSEVSAPRCEAAGFASASPSASASLLPETDNPGCYGHARAGNAERLDAIAEFLAGSVELEPELTIRSAVSGRHGEFTLEHSEHEDPSVIVGLIEWLQEGLELHAGTRNPDAQVRALRKRSRAPKDLTKLWEAIRRHFLAEDLRGDELIHQIVRASEFLCYAWDRGAAWLHKLTANAKSGTVGWNRKCAINIDALNFAWPLVMRKMDSEIERGMHVIAQMEVDGLPVGWGFAHPEVGAVWRGDFNEHTRLKAMFDEQFYGIRSGLLAIAEPMRASTRIKAHDDDFSHFEVAWEKFVRFVRGPLRGMTSGDPAKDFFLAYPVLTQLYVDLGRPDRDSLKSLPKVLIAIVYGADGIEIPHAGLRYLELLECGASVVIVHEKTNDGDFVPFRRFDVLPDGSLLGSPVERGGADGRGIEAASVH